MTPNKRNQSAQKCQAVLWLDASPPIPEPTGQLISHVTTLSRNAWLLIQNFRIGKELNTAYDQLKHSHKVLASTLEDLNRAQRSINEDLARAERLQNGLLPRKLPGRWLRGCAFRYIPAGKVGGDYYDCFAIGPDKLGIVIADVSGHGITAALIMTMFKLLLRTHAEQLDSPAEVLKRINQVFIEELDGRHFVTVYFAVFHGLTWRLTWCSAGHIPQYHVLAAKTPEAAPQITEMESQGLVLGFFPDTMLKDQSMDLPPESRLMLFTDGISEAHGSKGVMFGMDRVRAQVSRFAAEPAESLAQGLMDELRNFREGEAVLDESHVPGGERLEDLADDATLVIVDL